MSVARSALLGAITAAGALSACGGSSAPSTFVPDAATVPCPDNDAGATLLDEFDLLDAEPEPSGGFTGVTAMAADDEALYFVIDSNGDTSAASPWTTQVYRVPACGGPATFVGSRTSPGEINGASSAGTYSALVASGRVFLSMGDGIYSVPTTGGAMATETAIVQFSGGPLAVYGDHVYWIDAWNGPSPTLWAVETGGGHPAHAVVQSPSPMSWSSIAADAEKVYVTAVALPGDGGALSSADEADGSILAIALSDGTISAVVPSVYGPADVVLAGETLYFTSNMYQFSVDTLAGTGAIAMVPADGGPVTVLANGENPPPQSLLVTEQALYWIDTGGVDGQTTIRALVRGRMPVTVPFQPAMFDDLILSPSGAYWFSSFDSSFGRMAL